VALARTEYVLNVDYTAQAQAEVNRAVAGMNKIDREAQQARRNINLAKADAATLGYRSTASGFGIGSGVKAKRTGFDLFGMAKIGRGGFGLSGGFLMQSPIGGKIIGAMAISYGAGALATGAGNAIRFVNRMSDMSLGQIASEAGRGARGGIAAAFSFVGGAHAFRGGMNLGGAIFGGGEDVDRMMTALERRFLTGGVLTDKLREEITRQVTDIYEKRLELAGEANEVLFRSWNIPASRLQRVRQSSQMRNEAMARDAANREQRRAERVATGWELGEGN